MNLSSECLQASQVGSLLQGNLTPEEYESAQNHLEQCESCRALVEATIGPEQWWSDVQSVLVNSRSGSFSQRSAFSSDAGPNEPSAAKLLDLLGPTDDPNMLGRIGPYEIIGLLGQGGMGAVFKGFDRSLNRFVAIKMLLPHLAASGAARKRFAREGQAVAAVVDDHVMAIHCVDEWQGVPYLVMTYSRGVSLQKRLSDNGPLELREILRIGMQAAKGLAAAHAQGIVHRDIKPANIFLDQNVERVQLMDFGLARAVDDASLTRSGTLAGTPQYMSPEQARAETVDHRSDLFSLGSVMYAMCTGHAPFRAESSYSVLRLITDKEPRPIREVNPDVPEWLCAIIGKLMAKQISERFESAKEVALLLEDCLAHVQQPMVKELPGGITQNLLPTSGSSHRAGLLGRFKRIDIRSWLLAGISVAAIMLIAIMLQNNGPQRSGQGTSGPLTAAHANLGDHDRLQGAWQSLDSKKLPVMPGGRNQFSVSFLTDRMAMSAPQRAGIGTFSLSPDTVPKQIDCRLTFGDKHIELKGIYEFHDSQLWLCLTEGEQRPKSFDNPPTIAGLMTFAMERKQVELPDADSNASLALSDWSQSQNGAGVFTTYTLSIPGIETISQGLAAGGPAVKEFSEVPGFPGKVFTLRYFLPNLSPRGMAFVAGTSFQSSLDLIELAKVAEHKRLVKVFSYPDSATGASDPIGAVPVNRPVETPEVEPMESSLKISILKAGENQADWLKEIDATGEIIYGYEVVVQNANVSAPPAGDAAKAAPAESPLLVDARKALQTCQNSLSWKQKFDMRVTNSYVHSQVGKVTIESRVRRDAPRMVEGSLQTFDDKPKDYIRLDNWRLDDGEMFISRTTTVGQKKLTGLMTIKGRQKASWRMFESSSSFAMEGHFPGNQGRTLMELLMESKEPDVRMEKLGDHDCLRISDSNDWGTMTVWIDAGPSRRLRRCESFKERGNRFADGRVGEDKDTANLESFSYFVEDIQYKVIDGIEIAVSCRLRSTSIPNGGAKQEASTEYRRTEIHLRPDFSINNPFVGDFDNGARINDGDAFDRDAAFRWQDGKLTKPSIVNENKRPSDATVPLKSTKTNSVVGQWKVAKLADMPAAELVGATVVIDKNTVKMHVPSQKGPHPHWRYTLVAEGEIDLCENDDAKGETTSRAKFSLEGKTLYLALNAKKGDYPRPESSKSEVPQAGVQYIVLKMDELVNSTGTAVPHDSGDERHDDKPQAPAQPLGKTLQKLQGKWRLTRQIAGDGEESSRPYSIWEFKEDRIIVRDGGPGGAMLIQVDDTHSPVHVKLSLGTDDESGLGLLSVDGDKVTLCLGERQKTPEPGSRPEKLQWVSGV